MIIAIILLALGVLGIAASMKRDQWWLLLGGLLCALVGVMLLVMERP